MAKCYVIFEWHRDVYCENVITSWTKDGKKEQQKCGKRINCSRTLRFVTTDLNKAIAETKDKPDWGYETEELV